MRSMIRFAPRTSLPALLILAAGVATACAFSEELRRPSVWQRLVGSLTRAFRETAIE